MKRYNDFKIRWLWMLQLIISKSTRLVFHTKLLSNSNTRIMLVTLLGFASLMSIANPIGDSTHFIVLSGSNVMVKGSAHVVGSNMILNNNGVYQDSTGSLDVSNGLFTGTGTTDLFDLNLAASTGTSRFNSLVSVSNTADLSSGNIDANNLLFIRSDKYNSANVIIGGMVSNNIQGITIRASALSGNCPSFNSTISLNVSGTAVLYQWQYSTDSLSWTDIPGASTNVYNASVSTTGYYRCHITTNNSSFSQLTKGLKLTLRTNPSSVTNVSVCSGGSYDFNGTNYRSSGTYTTHLPSVSGCDSTATLVLTILPAIITEKVNLNGCDSIAFKGITYKTDATAFDTIRNILGCDSVVRIVSIHVGFKASIVASKNPLCGTATATFTCTVNNGNVLLYQWYKNGSQVVGATTASFTTTGSVLGDDIQLRVRSKTPVCSMKANDTTYSNIIRLVSNTNASLSVGIVASASSICTGTNVTFTATPTNGGNTPIYQWKINGINTGLNTSTFSSNTLHNSDIVSCVLSSGNTCQIPSSVSSNTIIMKVAAPVSLVANTGNPTICIIGGTTTLSNATTGGIWTSSNNSVATVNASGVVTAKASGSTIIGYTVGATGCSATTYTTVNVSPITMLPITGPSIVCQGSTIQLSNNTVGTGTWSTTNTRGAISTDGKLTGLVAGGNAIVSYSVSNGVGVGCNSIAYYNVQVAALPAKPSVKNVPKDGPYCTGSRFTLTGTPSGGTWTSNTNAASITNTGLLSVLNSGSINITYTTIPDVNGCTNNSVFVRSTSACTVSPKVNNEIVNTEPTKVNIYPNPAHGMVTIDYAQWIKDNNTQLIITDITGKVLMSRLLTDKQTKINTAEFKPGIYLVTIQSTESKTTEKLVVE